MSKYLPGQSGNPSGRRVGSLNKRTQLAKLFDPHAQALIDKAVELALSGDVNALRLCIDRLVPKVKDEAPKLTLPNLSNLPPKSILTTLIGMFSGQEVGIQDLKHLALLAQSNMLEEGAIQNTEESIRELAELVKKYERAY